MHDPLDNIPSDSRENAAASQDRGGPSGVKGRIAFIQRHIPYAPRCTQPGRMRFWTEFSRGRSRAVAHSGKPPLATTRAAPALRAGLRIVET